jgi:pilus assembly protein CpaE
LKIAVISRDDSNLAEIAKLLRARESSDEVDMVAGNVSRVSGLVDEALPDVLVIDQPSIDDGDLEQLERLSGMHPRMAFIVLCRQQSPEFLLQAMRAGVREVLAFPASAATLYPAIERIGDKLERRGQSNGKVLAFISCKGGSGATFLATNLAYALAASGKRRVAVIDMNLQFGDASLFVSDHKPLATLSDVAQQIHRLDPSFLASSMLNVTDNYGVLAAPSDPAHANDVKPDHIDAIIKLARRQYDFVLLDVGRSLDAVSIRGLDHADMIFPILQTTLPYIRDGKRLLNVFRSLEYGKEKIHLIVNRHDKGGEIRLQDLEAAFDTHQMKTIPNHYDAAAASVNQGVPIMKLAPNSPITKALVEFAQNLSGDGVTAAAPGWLGRMLQRGKPAQQ